MKQHILPGIFLLLSFTSYSQDFYDVNTIQVIEISFTQSNWDYQMDTAKNGSEGYIMAQWVKVNGVQFDSVGVKYKGNSSYNSNNTKNPLHIELDTYINQSYQNYTDIKLGNGYSDPSMIREVLSYSILKNYMHCSKSNFAQVYINGSLYGAYSNTESVNKKFTGDHFYSSGNTLIKCNPVSVGGSNLPNLSYLGTDSSLYYSKYELKSDFAWQDLIDLCNTLNNNPATLDQIMDIDRALWMLAFNNVMVNLDSYTGAFAQNYYEYMDNNGRFNSIVWDLNMSFGGFNMTGLGPPSSVTQMQNMSPTLHSASTNRPLIKNLLADPMYKRMYIAHMKTITDENFANGNYVADANTLFSIVDTAVQSDPYKFFTYTQFQNSMTTNYTSGPMTIPGIQNLMGGRNTYLQSTTEFQQVAPSVSGISSSPAVPNINDTIWITATITGSTYAYLGNRDYTPEIFSKTQMYDDGLHSDGAAGDNVFGAYMVATSPLMEYYIYAENSNAGIFSPVRAEHEFYSIVVNVAMLSPGDIVINELMASNSVTVADDNGEYNDWMEIYNNTSNAVNLGTLYATDDFTNNTKWKFPNSAVIPANGYLIVWLDEDTTQSGYHANFKLSSSGEQIKLSYANGTELDSVVFPALAPDMSYQRCPNGTGAFTASMPATFNSENCLVGVEEVTEEWTVTVFPNPASSQLNMISEKELGKVEIYNSTGQLTETFSGSGMMSLTMNISHFSNGMYFIKMENSSRVIKIIVNK
ncbi:MAG: CotH kinase family protein [Bacteroidota bacterium]